MGRRSNRVTILVALAIACGACGRSEAPRGVPPALQNVDQIRVGPPAIPGVEGPFGITQVDVPGQPWQTGPAEIVTMAELMARRGRAVARDRSVPSGIRKIRPDRAALSDNPDARAVAQWPPSPWFRAGGPSVAFVHATPNVDIGSFADTGGATPPDTMGDVGPTQYVLAMNGRVRAVSKATGAVDPVFDLDSDVFYGAAAQGASTGDPRVRYDRRAGRWYILMFNIAVPNRYLLAVSSTSTITASTTWTIFFWANTRTQGGGGSVPCLGDYPTLGVDEDALYVGVNQFCGSSLNSLTFDSTSVYVLNRASVLGSGSATITQFDGVVPTSASAGPYTPQGVDNFDSGTNEGYFIGVDNLTFSTLMLRRVSNPAGVPTLSGNVPLTVPTTRSPVAVPQPGAVPTLSAIDDRLMNAVIRNGTLWTLHQIGVDASGVGAGGVGVRTAERWYQVGSLASTPSLIQSGTVFDSAATNPTHHWMGSIMVNGQGHVALGASRGGAATFVNTEFTGRLASAPAGTMEVATQYSANTATLFNLQGIPGQRWGDYSYTSVDPNDDMTMWTLQEYPNATNSYAVRLVRLQAPPPAAIASLTPSSVATGQTSVNVTVTGTSTGGSGFFDPGAGFANRIAASFSGTGVTVTAITVTSPTALTLTLNTVGAATGARTLTVTNPDGQQAALASALTISAGGSTPIAVNDAYGTPVNTPLIVAAPGVLGNDDENGGGAMTATLVTTPASGALNFASDGSFTFTPNSGFTGQTSFTYQAVNGGGSSNTATVTITVVPSPTAVNDSYSTPFNTPLSVTAPGVLANDNANGGGTMTSALVSGSASGSLTLASDGSFTFTPTAGFIGQTTFSYRAQTTTGGAGNAATVTITVNPPAPTAVNDAYSTLFNTPLVVPAPGVLGNDDANGGTGMTATLVNGPANGTVSLAANGSFTFTPFTGFAGQTTFTYRAQTTNSPQSNSATVTITVLAQMPPSFTQHPVSGTWYVGQTAQFAVALAGIPFPLCQWQRSDDLGASWTNLTNTAPYTLLPRSMTVDALTLAMSGSQFRCLASNAHGTAASNAATLSVAAITPGALTQGAYAGQTDRGGSFSFTLNAGSGQGQITPLGYSANDGCISSTTTIFAPIAVSNNAFKVTSNGIGACTDATRTIFGTFGTTTGASGRAVHIYSLTPPPGCTCVGTFTTEWSASTGPALAPQIALHPASANPGAGQRAQFVAAATGTPTATFQWEMSANGGGTWTDVPAAAPFSGSTTPTLTIVSSGVAANVGTQFRVRAQNASGTATSNAATLGPPGQPPTTIADSFSTPFQTPLNVAAPGVLGNDVANSGGAPTAQFAATASNGVVSLNADGSFSYTPNSGFAGVDTFSYRAVNGAGPGNTATVTITVSGPVVVPPPTTEPDAYPTGHDQPLVVPAPGVLGNDAANGGTGMVAVLVTGASNGVVSLNADGSFTYTPNTGFSGPDSFTYRAVSSGGAGNAATVTIIVAAPGVPVPPSNFRIVGMQGNDVTFAWTIPTSGPTPTGFQIEGGITPGTTLGLLQLGVTPSVTLGLPTGSFFLRLRTVVGGQLSGPSNEILAHINVPVPPSAPSNLLGLVDGSAVQLAWTPTFGGGAPTGAILDVTGTLSGSVPLGPGDMFSYPAMPAGTYTFSVRQTNAGGAGPSSNAVTLSFPGGCGGAPQPPANFLAFKAGGQLYLRWDPPATGVAPSGYTLHVTGSFTGSFPMGSSRSLTVPGPAGSYTFSVTASNACGSSVPTATQTVTFP